MARTSTSEVALGLRYLPASVKLPILRQEDLFDKLEGRGVRYIRFQWVDYTNITRYRVIPLTAFRKLLSASRPGIALTKAVFGIIGASVAPGFSSTGEYLYTPDLNSTRICGYAPGHACLMGWFEEKLPIRDNAGKEVTPKLSLCPRGLLRDIVNKGKVLGVEFLVGFETEFILLKSTHPIEAASNAPWSASRALLSGSAVAKCLEDIADALQNSDIELLMYHAEAAPGQYEIVTGPLPPLEATDAVVFTRETVVNMAAKHGLRATFSPRVNADNCGTAAHAHISLHPTSQRPTNPPPENPNTNRETTMTPLERSFLQSILENLPSSAAFTLPTAASYDRVQDGIRSCGTYACWGEDNKDVAVRLTGPPGSHHIELRTIDGTANPHIALATILGLGLIGVEKGLELKIEAIGGAAVKLNAEERTKRGNVVPLPRTLSEARDIVRQDTTINNVLGQEFVQKYLSTNEAMEKFLKGDTAEEDRLRSILNY
ncbi:glutamine synthetase/guanido kinase [Lactifluus subvellereus]|nr:glutamine synthetase/guanido kinase [Lactifluus subvellereus]